MIADEGEGAGGGRAHILGTPLEDFSGKGEGIARLFLEIPVSGPGDQNHDHPLHHVRRDGPT